MRKKNQLEKKQRETLKTISLSFTSEELKRLEFLQNLRDSGDIIGAIKIALREFFKQFPIENIQDLVEKKTSSMTLYTMRLDAELTKKIEHTAITLHISLAETVMRILEFWISKIIFEEANLFFKKASAADNMKDKENYCTQAIDFYKLVVRNERKMKVIWKKTKELIGNALDKQFEDWVIYQHYAYTRLTTEYPTQLEYQIPSKLLEIFGNFISQLYHILPDSDTRISIEFCGDLLCFLHTQTMVDEICIGIGQAIGINETKINTKVLFEYDIQVLSYISPWAFGRYTNNVIKATLLGKDKHPFTIEAMIYPTNSDELDIKIYSLQGVSLMSHFSPNMVIICNIDEPGLICTVGGAFAKENINIIHLAYGSLRSEEKTAIQIVHTEKPCLDTIIETLRKDPSIKWVKKIVLPRQLF